MTKHLFRLNFIKPTKEIESKLVEKTESFRKSDEALLPHIPVHVLDVHDSDIVLGDHGNIINLAYGRDTITEWGDTLFVNPGLIGEFFFHYFKRSPFKRMMGRLKYKKKIRPHYLFSEGGLYVFGKEFIFMSDSLGPLSGGIWDKVIEDLEKVEKKDRIILEAPTIIERNNLLRKMKEYLERKTGIPIYFVPSIRGGHGHIDTSYQIIDSLRLIYVSADIYSKSFEDYYEGLREKMEGIAKKHNFEIRKYRIIKYDKRPLNVRDDSSPMADKSGINNGINSIIADGKFFTGNINPEEKEYLESHGLEVIVVPLGGVDGAAGLRCVYGEFSL